MIIEIKDENISVESLKEVLVKSGINAEIKESAELACISEILDDLNKSYSEVFGDDTIKLISNEVLETVGDGIDGMISLNISKLYEEKVNEYARKFDEPTIAVATISNNISVHMKSLYYGIEDIAVVTFGKDIYECSVKLDKNGREYITIGEMDVYMEEFLRVGVA